MITSTISQHDIKHSYQQIQFWNRDGITYDAISVCRDQWNDIKGNQYSYTTDIRNQNYDDTFINNLNKW